MGWLVGGVFIPVRGDFFGNNACKTLGLHVNIYVKYTYKPYNHPTLLLIECSTVTESAAACVVNHNIGSNTHYRSLAYLVIML